ncbi:hypothetical protein AALB16_11640 [Lachnospiraceae bacterium 62-35]
MKEYLTSDTKDWAFHTFSRMPKEELSKELEVLVSSRNMYLDSFMADSFVFAYLDTVYDVICDVLVMQCMACASADER